MAASRVACNSFNIGTNTTISITRDNKAYTHTITYKFGSATGTIATKTSQTSIVWSPTASTLYAQIPDAVSGYGTITCQTYNGSTLIGTTTAGFYAYAVKSECLPTVTATIVDTNASTIALTGNSSNLICYVSKPKVTLTATAKNSATIKSRQIYNPVGLTATTSPYTFDTVYSKEFRCTATDSRGYAITITKETGFIEYEPCHFITTPIIERTESTSTTATINIKGYCFKGNFGVADNTLTLKYRYKTTSGSYGSYVTISGVTWNTDGTFTASASVPNLSLSEQYKFEVIAQDKLTSFGDGEEILLTQGIGDLRIGKDYVMTKNNMIVGDKDNEDWKCFKARRKLNDVYYAMNYGIGGQGGTLELRKSTDGSEGDIVARYDIREDKHMYNYFNGMSVAEITSMIPTMATEGNQGYTILNGGNSSPILIQWGRLKIAPTGANVTTKVQVNFLYQFSGMPFVKPERLSGVPANAHISPEGITETGFTCCLNRFDTTPTDVIWFAIGNGLNALPE